VSLRTEFKQESENYKYSFLVALTASVLRRPHGTPLREDEVEKLREAKDFVQRLIVGTEMISGNKTHAYANHESFRALSFVLNPISSLQSFISQERSISGEESELLSVFKRIADYIEQAITAGSLIQHPDLRITTDFFNWLATSLLQSVSKYPVDKFSSYGLVKAYTVHGRQ